MTPSFGTFRGLARAILRTIDVSSLRIASLRMCWLETFLAVANMENISEAARSLSIDQSTASRYMQALQEWLGKDLIEAGTVNDPDDARVSIGLTEAGREFSFIVERIINDLAGFRDERAEKRQILEEMSSLVSKLQAERRRKNALEIAKLTEGNVDGLQRTVDGLTEDYPLVLLKAVRASLRAFYNRYEVERNKEKRRKKRRKVPLPTKLPA